MSVRAADLHKARARHDSGGPRSALDNSKDARVRYEEAEITPILSLVAQIDAAVDHLEQAAHMLERDCRFAEHLMEVRLELVSCGRAAEEMARTERPPPAPPAESGEGSKIVPHRLPADYIVPAEDRVKIDRELSGREQEVLLLLSRGATNQDIAHRLGVSINTVKWHLKNIFGKLRVANRTIAVLVARQKGFVN